MNGEWAALTAECEDLEPVVPLEGASRVVEVSRPTSVVETTDSTGARRASIDANAMRPMLEAGLRDLTGSDSPWRTIFPDYSATMRIGIKVNCLNETLTTSPRLVKALVSSLRESLDVGPERIIVWDRRLDELQPNPPRARLTEDDLGAMVLGTVRSVEDTGGP
ncbi:MAG: hypothetical protein HYZ27_11510, partial [Deltaproteobacteria bacterium]|nr:hypothetical protein [Deltaproteobacteria bacterium]